MLETTQHYHNSDGYVLHKMLKRRYYLCVNLNFYSTPICVFVCVWKLGIKTQYYVCMNLTFYSIHILLCVCVVSVINGGFEPAW